ncbi:hypothetical protein [Legionella pneumophila]|uniref:Uncharacterized protein n=1 Tax=Legionella pneumophila subsp. pascullei TaxID=91890 RepID=A0AAX2J096_LEGPN|nr:hypothetical protein [Legionella pneumophila]AMP90702.1 hypothetical protein AXF35_13795 [Legionella pneumophila subsp. pascullei]AMP93685.1 hypothetical protein AXF36_14160 [Legionella pneumophila subsp. pascullei]AMP96603.1 hypothetical protein AXF37_13795 [Legionella pneumophila subsp. pascullei]SQG91643.1 Uncharacterised protein [Legionella pneumophila subsp. pascullei]VEH08189.1 Uncharacterised protein [Legionella pneumophila subsp. pascullei]
MKEQFFQPKELNTLVQSIEKPIQDLLDLNLKTLKSVSYVTPIELFNVLKPEEILEKNMNLFIQNSQKAMNYMFNVFQIMEHHWIKIYGQMAENTTEKKVNPIIGKASHKVDTNAPKSSASKKSITAKSKTKPVVAQSKSKISKAKPKTSSPTKVKVNTQERPTVTKQQSQMFLSSLQKDIEKQGMNTPVELKNSVAILKNETKDIAPSNNKPK